MTLMDWLTSSYNEHTKVGDLFAGTTISPSESLIEDLSKLERAGCIKRTGPYSWVWTELGIYIGKMKYAWEHL